MAVITNYHKPSGLKQHKVNTLQFVGQNSDWSHWSKIKVGFIVRRAALLPRGSGGESVSLPF